jgi:hypothetical protein
MASLRSAALRDYNANIGAVKDAATKYMQDTIVSVVGFDYTVKREIVNSNPHVLHPKKQWSAVGYTAMYDAVGDLIEMFEAVPDYNDPKVNFLLTITTDGEENNSKKYNQATLARKIRELIATDRWTFVFRVPRGHAERLSRDLGVPRGNVQEWDQTEKGVEASTQATTAALDKFYATRATGVRSSSVFYADATAVDTKSLIDVSKEIKLFVVPATMGGVEIKPFVEMSTGKTLLKGSAFYQLTKTEARVQDTKLILVRDRKNGKVYAGADARSMIGLPTVGNARLHPGDHGNYDIFIQSTSINRKLVGGTGIVYWEKIGVPFTAADTAYLNGPVAGKAAKPVVVQLPKVAPTNKPTPSPLTPVPTRIYFASRSAARASGKRVYDAGITAQTGKRWYVLNK